MNNNLKAHLALIIANILYGLNYVIAKGIMPDFMSPRAIIFLRALGAIIVFNLIHKLFVKEKIERKDLLRLMACGLFGVAINQVLFFEGLNLTTPINASLIITTAPISVMVFSLIMLKEKINLNKIIGIGLGTTGAIILILMSGQLTIASDTFIGNILVFINISSYAFYLVLVKPIMIKYKPLTVMKWVFNFGFIFIFPFCFQQVLNVDFAVIPTNIWFSIAFVIIGVTILAYLLNVYALKSVSPVVNSSYIYSQPAIAAITAIIYLNEQLTLVKIIAATLIFIGLYFVNIRKEKRISLKG